MQKIKKIIEYFESFGEILPTANTHFVVSESQTVDVLQNSSIDGIRMIISYPGVEIEFNNSLSSSKRSFLIYVVTKKQQASNNYATEKNQYFELLDIAEKILDKIYADTSGASGNDEMLSILPVSVMMLPEYNVFGGWNGWSMTFVFE